MSVAMTMGLIWKTAALGVALLGVVEPALADRVRRERDPDAVLQARREGRVLPLGEIRRRVLPLMDGAEYIGVDFDPGGAIYTLKFMRNGNVIWVDVDGRTGQVLGRIR